MELKQAKAMTKIDLFYSSALLAALFAVTASCKKEATAPEVSAPVEAAGSFTMTLKAAIAQDDPSLSKATISEGWKFSFTNGDKISLTNNQTQDYYTLTRGTGDNFSGTVTAPAAQADWYAYYPSNSLDLTGQTGKSKAAAAAYYAYAGRQSDVAADTRTLSIALKPRTAILVIENVKESIDINIKSDGKWVKGLAAASNSASFDVMKSDVKVSLLSVAATGTYYVAVPAGAQIDIYDGETLIKKTKSTGLVAGCYYSLFNDLSLRGTANCYIVEEAGLYKFNATKKGNSNKSVGIPVKAKVLWESFGTSETPSAGDLVKDVGFEDGYVKFTATSKKGNAVIAVKDYDGKILWSWHIWLTDAPASQVYYNNASMMDRNLGATSATPSDGVRTFGLLYQWGRKDPFLGSSSKSRSTEAASVLATGVSWNTAPGPKSPVESVAIPTTFITGYSTPHDWTTCDDNLWGSTKTMYDPCPVGWRVPDGGIDGVWYKADFSSTTGSWDSNNMGMSFTLQSGGSTWYPAVGYRTSEVGVGFLGGVGSNGSYWSCSVYNTDAYFLYFDSRYFISRSEYSDRAYGFAVRCLAE